VVLLIVGCLLSILATARRTARPHRPGAAVRAEHVRATSESVARLRRDVSGWAKRG
jgi:hypothetical protein